MQCTGIAVNATDKLPSMISIIGLYSPLVAQKSLQIPSNANYNQTEQEI